MKMGAALLVLTASILLTGCASFESINNELLPVNHWYEQEYEATRYSQRYKFTKTDIITVRKAVLNMLPQIGLTASYSTDDIVASGNPVTMFSMAECESWAEIDRAKTKELSGGWLVLTCEGSNKNSLITVTLSLKSLPAGTLMVLDYETNNPKLIALGLVGPRRPPPAASKAGAAKFWELLGQSLPDVVRKVAKEDLS